MRAILAMLTIAVAALPAPADTRRIVEEGRKLFQQQKYAQAHDKFIEAAADLPESPLLKFNRAATFYKRRDYDKAIELYGEALQTKDLQLEAAAKYNLGNCHFQQAVKNQTDLAKAIGLLDKAMAYYRDALETLADPQQARYNLEKSKLLKKLLLDKKKKEMEQQQKKQQDKDHQEEKKDEQSQGGGDEQQKNENRQDQSPQQPDEDGDRQAQQDQQQGLSAEDAEKLLNAIRERQKQDERENRARRPMRYAPVDRDW